MWYGMKYQKGINHCLERRGERDLHSKNKNPIRHRTGAVVDSARSTTSIVKVRLTPWENHSPFGEKGVFRGGVPKCLGPILGLWYLYAWRIQPEMATWHEKFVLKVHAHKEWPFSAVLLVHRGIRGLKWIPSTSGAPPQNTCSLPMGLRFSHAIAPLTWSLL